MGQDHNSTKKSVTDRS